MYVDLSFRQLSKKTIKQATLLATLIEMETNKVHTFYPNRINRRTQNCNINIFASFHKQIILIRKNQQNAN